MMDSKKEQQSDESSVNEELSIINNSDRVLQSFSSVEEEEIIIHPTEKHVVPPQEETVLDVELKEFVPIKSIVSNEELDENIIEGTDKILTLPHQETEAENPPILTTNNDDEAELDASSSTEEEEEEESNTEATPKPVSLSATITDPISIQPTANEELSESGPGGEEEEDSEEEVADNKKVEKEDSSEESDEGESSSEDESLTVEKNVETTTTENEITPKNFPKQLEEEASGSGSDKEEEEEESEEDSDEEEEHVPAVQTPVKESKKKEKSSSSGSSEGEESESDEEEESEAELEKDTTPNPASTKKNLVSESEQSDEEEESEDEVEKDTTPNPASTKKSIVSESEQSESSEEEESSTHSSSSSDNQESKTKKKISSSSGESSDEHDEVKVISPVKKALLPRKRLSSSSLEPMATQATASTIHHRSKKEVTQKKASKQSSSEDSDASSSKTGGSSSKSSSQHHRSSSSSSSSEGSNDEDKSEGSSSESSEGEDETKTGRFKRMFRVGMKKSKKLFHDRIAPTLWKLNTVMSGSRFGPQVVKVKSILQSSAVTIREDFQELKRLRRSFASKPRNEWNFRQLPPRSKIAIGRAFLFFISCILMSFVLFSSATGIGLRDSGKRRSTVPDYPPDWKRSRQLSFPELMNLINVHDNSIRNDSSVKIKRLPTLDKPVYLTMTSKDLVQIKRPAVRKKRPDEPRAVRTFGCLRDGCRGLEIEDLLDRGWQMRFRAAQKNDTYKNINYRVTFLLTDTTQLNHMRAVRPDLYEAIYNTYERKCYLIAFDGADAIGGNKGQQLKVKEKFVRKYGCKFTELAISPASYRLYLEDECRDLESFAASDVTWLLKPETGSQGQGITFHTEISDIMQKVPKFFPCAKREWKSTERYLVQEYIEKPLLLKKCKFDARVYMNVASSSPFLVYYHEGYLRRALAPYTALSRDRRVYLTNTHFQSMKKDFKLSEHIWSFQEFQQYLTEQGRTGAHYIASILNPQIKKVALFIFQSARHKLKKRKGTFHIMGLDFMIDEDFHIWFIEANGFPGFTWSINFDTRTMVEEWFNLAQQVHENPRFYMLQREGDRYGGFEMIFSELEEERTQTLYNPCQEFKYNRGYTAPLKEANRLFAQISGKGGRTERFKHFANTVKGSQFIGGSRHDQLKTHEAYFKKFGCRLNGVHFSPATYALYEPEECNNFFTEHAGTGHAWVVKPIVSPGHAEEFRVYSSQEAMKQDYGDCSQRVPDFVVQKLVPQRIQTLYKWWDIRVYMLIASTKPYLVWYHHGFARTSKLSYVPGGEAKEPAPGEAGAAAAAASGEEKEDEEVELEEEEASEEEEEPASVAKIPEKANTFGDGSSGSSEEEGGGGANPAGTDPLYANQPPAEPWEPLKITTGAQWKLGDEFITLEALEDEMARADLVGSRWLSSVFDVYATRVAHFLFQSGRESLQRGNESYQITSLNFLLDHKLQIHFIGAKNVDADSIPNVDVLQEHKANFLETLAGLVLEVQTMPAAFARLRRGDSYGQWRLVFSEMEEKQRSEKYDPCEEFKRNLQITKSSLFKDAWLHQHTLKSHARNKRELRKYVDRKWESTCKHRPTAELRASCIRNTISYRYKKYIEKERIPYQEGYVENTIRELQNRLAQGGKAGGAAQGGGL